MKSKIVARYADVETMLLLTAAEHIRARTDSAYILSHYRQILDERGDASDKFSAALKDFCLSWGWRLGSIPALI